MRRLGFVLAVTGVAAVGIVAGLDRPTAAPATAAHGVVLPPTTVQRICPNLAGSAAAPAVMTAALVSGRGTGTDLRTAAADHAGTGHPVQLHPAPAAQLRSVSARGAVAVNTAGSAAAYVVADEERLFPSKRARGLVSLPCPIPGTDFWLTGADGRVGYLDWLYLVNPGTEVANVSVSGWSLHGGLSLPRLQGFTIPAGRAVAVPVGSFAPDQGLVSLHVRSNSGQITAAVLDRRLSGLRPNGTDWIPPGQPPATSQVVPGYVGGPGARAVEVTNPGPVDATVKVKIVTAQGAFAPAGHPQLVVRSHHTVSVDLADSFRGLGGAVALDSDQPILAAGYSKVTAAGRDMFPDLQWQPSAAALSGPAGLPSNAPPFRQTSRVFFAAPTTAAEVRVVGRDGSRLIKIPAGRMVPADVRDDLGGTGLAPLRFELVSGGPVYLSRTLFALGAHGPLITAEQPTPLPPPVLLPAVVQDPRAALP
jgi:hypothetical protein